MTGVRGSVLACALCLFAAAGAAAKEGSMYRPATRSPGGIVAGESPAASQIGRAVLDRGGNAVDAAASMVFALNVARPQSCGVGGGGFMVYRAASGETAALDFREAAPAAYTPTTLSGPGKHTAFTGHLTIGVPGTLAGMAAALARYGTISLADAIEPARELAEKGVAVPDSLSQAMAQHAARLRQYPAAADQFLVGGASPYPPGSTLVQPDLAKSLALIQAGGPDALYRGPIGQLIVDDMRSAVEPATDAGVMTMADLNAYEAKWRDPLVGSYRGRDVIAMPPPTSGGVATLEMLNLLEGFDLHGAGQSSADALHLIAESEKIAWADRNRWLGDPDKVNVPTAGLVSKAYAAKRRAEIDPAHAKSYTAGQPDGAPAGARQAGGDANPNGSTTSLSVIDRAGNALALTCTIEQTFGSAVVAPGTGFLLNNELTDFSGPGTANEPGPGKRPRSSISPTIVVDQGTPILAVGGAGGATIIMGSLLAVVDAVDFGADPAQAVDAERLDDQSGQMMLEDVRVDPAVRTDLSARGHEIVSEGEYGMAPRVQAAGVDPRTGERLGTTDPRSGAGDYAALASAARAGSEPSSTALVGPGTSSNPPPTAGPPCVDVLAPRVALRAIRRAGRLAVRVRAGDRGCGGAVARIEVWIARRAGRRCRFVTVTGRLTRPRACAKPVVLRLRSTGARRLTLPRHLPPGRYVVAARALDARGNRSAVRRLTVHAR
jgi:gamma-glutamyltranspeptidase/glutathione hydrolase